MRARLSIALLALSLAVAAPAALAGPAEDARQAAQERDWERAVGLYLQAHHAKPDDRDLTLALAEAARRTRNRRGLDAARDALFGLTKKNDKDWDAWVALGLVTLERARTLASGGTIAMEYSDAEDYFKRVIKAKPNHEGAHAGLAQIMRATNRSNDAVNLLSAFLTKKAESPEALYWRGQLRYDRAIADFQAKGNRYPLSDMGKDLFLKAQGDFRACTMGDPDNFDAYMQLAYCSQYLSSVAAEHAETAHDAYVAAVPLSLHSDRPVRGLVALHARDPGKLTATLGKLAKANPKHPALHFYLGYEALKAGKHQDAADAFEVYAKHGNNAAEGNYYLGMCYQRLNKPKKAHDHFFAALKANPAHDRAAFQLDAPIRDGGVVRARQSVKAAKELIAAYDKLLEIAPNNTLLLNNLAFTLREAYGQGRGKNWDPILEACRDAYVRASEVIGPFGAAAANLPFATRYGYAQIVSDTGLMFQFYPQLEDLEKAESYYLRALEYADDSYRDAFNNLTQIYAKSERWQDLYDLAAVASEKIVLDESRKPDNATRARAEQIMKKLLAEGKAEH